MSGAVPVFEMIIFVFKMRSVAMSVVEAIEVAMDPKFTTEEKAASVGTNILFAVLGVADMGCDIRSRALSSSGPVQVMVKNPSTGATSLYVPPPSSGGLCRDVMPSSGGRVIVGGRANPRTDSPQQGQLATDAKRQPPHAERGEPRPGEGTRRPDRPSNEKGGAVPLQKVVLKAGLSVADVARVIAAKIVRSKRNGIEIHDYCDILATVCFRAGDVGAFSAHANPQLFAGTPVEVGSKILSACSPILSRSKGLEQLGKLIKRKWENKQNLKINVIPPAAPIESDLEVGERTWKEMSEVLAIEDFADLTEIPEFFNQDKVLLRYICALTGLPIRFIMLVRGGPKEATVYYERESIEQWFSDHPNQRPDGWPKSLEECSFEFLEEFNAENAETIDAQDRIDTRLEELHDDMVNVFQTLNNSKKLSNN